MVALDKDKLERLFASSGLDAHIDELSVVFTAVLENGDLVTPYLKFEDCNEATMPRYFLPKEQWGKYNGLPHIDHDRGICAFDHTSSSVDPRYYEEAMVSVAQKAIETLNNTISGRCAQDFNEELPIYWSRSASGNCISFVDKWPSKPLTLHSFLLRDYSGTALSSNMLGIVRKRDLDKYCRLSSWRKYAEITSSKKLFEDEADKCLYIPFNKPLTAPLKRTVREWYEIIASNTDYVERYERFLRGLSSNDTFNLIICGVPGTSRGRTVVAFDHPSIPLEAEASLADLVQGAFGFETVRFFNVNDASQDWLFARGGIGETHDLNACLIGCGSLGGHLGIALMDSGVTEFQLIDNDCLKPENIARHVCGFESLNKNKVDALKARIENHNPNCACDAHDQDASKLLYRGNRILKKADIVFITAADTPLEYEFVNAKRAGILEKPLVLMWMEPYSLAAHAIVLNKPQDIYADLFDKRMEFKLRVVANASKMYKRDAGCNSMYMPYSGLDTQSFAIAFVRQLFDEYTIHKDKNYLFTWIGAISKASEFGAKISDLYADVSDYVMISEEISE